MSTRYDLKLIDTLAPVAFASGPKFCPLTSSLLSTLTVKLHEGVGLSNPAQNLELCPCYCINRVTRDKSSFYYYYDMLYPLLDHEHS
jgi:hypothetical protein